MARIGRSLRHRNYRLFFCGQSVSLVGTWLSRVAGSWLVYRLSHSGLMLGLASFAGLIPTFVLAPLAGVFVDRASKRRVLVVTQACLALHSAVLAALTLSGRVTIGQILGLSVLQGLVTAFDMPARQSLVVQLIEDRSDLPNAIALNSSMFNMARLIGPTFAGLLIATIGEGGCFAIDAVSYLAVIATLLMLVLPAAAAKATAPKRVLAELKEGLLYAAKSRRIFSVLCLLALVSFMGAPYMTLLPMIASEQLSGGASVLGYLTGASGLGALIGALFLASRQSASGLGRIIMISVLTFGVGLFFVGVSHSLWFSLPLMFLTGTGLMIQGAGSNTILQTVVEESKRGRVMSLFLMAYAGMMPFGGLFGGYLAERIGAARTLEYGGVACCLGALVFLRELGSISRAAASRVSVSQH